MYTILYALLLWHSHWENGKLNIYCDNEAVVAAINKCFIKSTIIAPLQTILLIVALFNINIKSTWIFTIDNTIADTLLCYNFTRLANLGFKDYRKIHRSEPLTPTSIFRQKLYFLLKTALQDQLTKDVTMQSQIMNFSQKHIATGPSQP
jgi:hypothetical protein